MELTSPRRWRLPSGAPATSPTTTSATVVYLAQGMQRPLLLEGEPGTGKTALAEALAAGRRRAADPAAVLRGDRRQPGALRLGLPAPDPAPAHAGGARPRRGELDPERGREVAVRRAVPAGPAGAAGAARVAGGAAGRRGRPGRRRVRGVPARGAVGVDGEHPRARHGHRRRRRRPSCSPPTARASSTTRSSGAASTTGSTTPASSARWRSCAAALPEVSERLAEQVVGLVQRLRDEQLLKPPGVAETLDWARALHRLGVEELDLETAARTLGAVVKYREDTDRVKQALDRMMAGLSVTAAAALHEPDEILLGFTRALRSAGVPVTHDRATSFLEADRAGRRRRPRRTYRGRPGHAVRAARTTWSATATSSRRGSAPASSCRARCRARSRARSARRCRWATPAETGGEDEPRVAAGRGERRPRCSGTATWRRCGPTRRRCSTR